MHISDRNVEEILKKAEESGDIIRSMAPIACSLGMGTERMAMLLSRGRQEELVDFVRVGLSVWFDRDLSPFMSRIAGQARNWKLPERFADDMHALATEIFHVVMKQGGLYSLD